MQIAGVLKIGIIPHPISGAVVCSCFTRLEYPVPTGRYNQFEVLQTCVIFV